MEATTKCLAQSSYTNYINQSRAYIPSITVLHSHKPLVTLYQCQIQMRQNNK